MRAFRIWSAFGLGLVLLGLIYSVTTDRGGVDSSDSQSFSIQAATTRADLPRHGLPLAGIGRSSKRTLAETLAGQAEHLTMLVREAELMCAEATAEEASALCPSDRRLYPGHSPADTGVRRSLCSAGELFVPPAASNGVRFHSLYRARPASGVPGADYVAVFTRDDGIGFGLWLDQEKVIYLDYGCGEGVTEFVDLIERPRRILKHRAK